MNDIIDLLFKTNAVKISPQDKPFWYTAGKLGPYFVNTEYLYGSDEKAADLLVYIDGLLKGDLKKIPFAVQEKTFENFREDSIYSDAMIAMSDYIAEHIDINKIDFVSGGERRDWFFSFLIAQFIQKPHITIFNRDCPPIISDSQDRYGESRVEEVTDLHGAKILHVADLINEASSYRDKWIKVIEKYNGVMTDSLVAFDRNQGGRELLAQMHVTSHALATMSPDLFEKALARKLISREQYTLVINYLINQDKAMNDFLKNHLNYIEESYNSGNPKTIERVKKCITGNMTEQYYPALNDLDSGFVKKIIL